MHRPDGYGWRTYFYPITMKTVEEIPFLEVKPNQLYHHCRRAAWHGGMVPVDINRKRVIVSMNESIYIITI